MASESATGGQVHERLSDAKRMERMQASEVERRIEAYAVRVTCSVESQLTVVDGGEVDDVCFCRRKRAPIVLLLLCTLALHPRNW